MPVQTRRKAFYKLSRFGTRSAIVFLTIPSEAESVYPGVLESTRGYVSRSRMGIFSIHSVLFRPSR